MKKWLLILLLIIMAAGLTTLAWQHQGHLTIVYDSWSMQISLWLTILILCGSFIIFYYCIRLFIGIQTAFQQLGSWWLQRRHYKANQQTIGGLYHLFEGNWQHAELSLAAGARYSRMPLLNYIAAATAAHLQSAFKKRDEYLGLIKTQIKTHPLAVHLSQVWLAIYHQRWNDALVLLHNLHQDHPKNCCILELLAKVYLELKYWDELKNLLPELHQYAPQMHPRLLKFELQVYRGWLLAAHNSNAIENKWDQLPVKFQRQHELLVIYIQSLVARNKLIPAEYLLKKALQRELNDELLQLYANLPITSSMKQLLEAERWVKNHPKNPILFWCLGRLCQKQELWGKALHYLEKSVALAPNSFVYLELGKMLADQHNNQAALTYYNQAWKHYPTPMALQIQQH